MRIAGFMIADCRLIRIKPWSCLSRKIDNQMLAAVGLGMDLREAIYTRRAVREFTDAPVDEKTLRQLIDAAIQAPSAVNQQPWSFCVVRDKAVLARISHEAKAHMLRTSPAGLVSHHFREILSDPKFDIFYHAPALIVISTVVESPWAVEDCALAAENMMLTARGAGLGTCWIGFAQTWLGTPEGKVALSLPATYVPVAPIIVGHPKSTPPQVPRKEPEIRWIGP
jgi:nitroreductase